MMSLKNITFVGAALVLGLLAFGAKAQTSVPGSVNPSPTGTSPIGCQLYTTNLLSGDVITLNWTSSATLTLSLYNPSDNTTVPASTVTTSQSVAATVSTNMPGAVLVVRNSASGGSNISFTLTHSRSNMAITAQTPAAFSLVSNYWTRQRLGNWTAMFNIGVTGLPAFGITATARFPFGSLGSVSMPSSMLPGAVTNATLNVPYYNFGVMLTISQNSFGIVSQTALLLR